MKISEFEQRSDDWLDLRKGKITGTRLGELYSPRGSRKIGFYETLAELLTPGRDNENRMERGLRLEDEAVNIFSKTFNKKTEKVGLCMSDVDDRIANSPDRLIKNGAKYSEAIEVKCLSPARHLQVVVEKTIPREFESQVVQYFCVNEDLEKLHVIFYDPDSPHSTFIVIVVTRESLGDKPKMFLDWQLQTLKEMDKIIEELSF